MQLMDNETYILLGPEEYCKFRSSPVQLRRTPDGEWQTMTMPDSDMRFAGVEIRVANTPYNQTLCKAAAEKAKPGPTFVTVNLLRGCARCGGEHHNMVFAKLKLASEEWTHWAPCPVNREPVMLAVE